MKFSSLPMVMRIAAARDVLIDALAALDAGEFVVTIASNRQDDMLLALVKPVIERELKARMHSLDKDLAALGINVGA